MKKWKVQTELGWEIVEAEKIIVDKNTAALLFLSKGELVRSFSPIGWLDVVEIK